MDREIRVLIVDENREALAQLAKQINYGEVSVIGEAGFGPVAYTWASQLKPDVVMVAVEEPIARALKTIETLSLGQTRWPVVVVSSKTDLETMRKAMRAGADDYVARQSSEDSLQSSITALIKREREREALDATGKKPAGHAGTIVSVFGVKGGIGKTTLATNLAACLAMDSKYRVALVDLDLQFGDVSLVMETPPEKTISDVVDSLDKMDADLIDGFLSKHRTGVGVLPAPLHVEGSEKITGDHIEQVLCGLAAVYDYVILDAPNTVNDIVLAALDASTLILLVTTPDIPCIRRTKAFLDLVKQWQYSEDKVKLVINKTGWRSGINPGDIEAVLRYPSFWRLPYDHAADTVGGAGGLFVQSHPNSKIAKSIRSLSGSVMGVDVEAACNAARPKTSLRKLLGVEGVSTLMGRVKGKLAIPWRRQGQNRASDSAQSIPQGQDLLDSLGSEDGGDGHVEWATADPVAHGRAAQSVAEELGDADDVVYAGEFDVPVGAPRDLHAVHSELADDEPPLDLWRSRPEETSPGAVVDQEDCPQPEEPGTRQKLRARRERSAVPSFLKAAFHQRPRHPGRPRRVVHSEQAREEGGLGSLGGLARAAGGPEPSET